MTFLPICSHARFPSLVIPIIVVWCPSSIQNGNAIWQQYGGRCAPTSYHEGMPVITVIVDAGWNKRSNFDLFFVFGLPGMTQLTRKSPIALRLILRGSLGPTA